MPSFRSKKKAKKARERESQAAAQPPTTQSQTAAPPSPIPAANPSPRESPLKRLLRRTSSSLKGLTNRRASVSSVVSRDYDPSSSSPLLQPLTPSRSRVEDPFNPFARGPSHTDASGGISRSGSLRRPITPLRPRLPDPSPPTPPTTEPTKPPSDHHHRKTSSLSSTTFPGASATPAQLVPTAKAQIKESPVVSVQTIASSRDPGSGSRESAAVGTGGEVTTETGLTLSDFGGGDEQRMHRESSLGLEISPGDAQSRGESYVAPLPPSSPGTTTAQDAPPSLGPVLGFPKGEPEPDAIAEDSQPSRSYITSPAQTDSKTHGHEGMDGPSHGTDVFGRMGSLITGVTDARAKGISPAGAPANITATDADMKSDGPSIGRQSLQGSSVGTIDWVPTTPIAETHDKTSEPLGEDVEGSLNVGSASPRYENVTTATDDSSAMHLKTPESAARDAEESSVALSPLVETLTSGSDAHDNLDNSESAVKDLASSSSSEPRVAITGTAPSMHPKIPESESAVRDLEEPSKIPSSRGLTTTTTCDSPPTSEKSAGPAPQDPEQPSFNPPSSPRLKPAHSFPDAHVPEPMDLPGVQVGHEAHHSYVVPALEPVLEETPGGTHVERFAGEAYLDEEVVVEGKGKGKAVDWDGMGGKVVTSKTGGQKKLHAFEESNTIKARHRASPPPSPGTESNPPWPQTAPVPPPLTNKPLDRTTYPALPAGPSKVRWEPIRPFPNRAQHTERAASGPYDAKGVYHEAGAGGVTFTKQGEMWIGKPPVPLDGVALQAAGGQDRGEKMSGRGLQAGASRTGQLVKEATSAKAATPATAAATSTPATQLPMLPFIPRIFAPQLTLDFQWADRWLPSDVTLETPTEHHTISLYDSIRNWTGLSARAPSKRITNTDTR